MKTPAELIGKRFGRLLVIARAENRKGHRFWRCVCDCGNEKLSSSGNLNGGTVRSCGCLQKEAMRKGRHGMYGTRIHQTWLSMHKRCRGTSTKEHKRLYHDRGIAVCDEWREFQPFYDWAMANGYTDALTLDRKDPDGDYCPENCRWATMKEQQNNRRNNRIIEINGKSKTLAQWSDEYGITQGCIQERIRRGWGEVEAVTTPHLRPSRQANIQGEAA